MDEEVHIEVSDVGIADDEGELGEKHDNVGDDKGVGVDDIVDDKGIVRKNTNKSVSTGRERYV